MPLSFLPTTPFLLIAGKPETRRVLPPCVTMACAKPRPPNPYAGIGPPRRVLSYISLMPGTSISLRSINSPPVAQRPDLRAPVCADRTVASLGHGGIAQGLCVDACG